MAPFVVTQLAQMICRVLLGRLLDPLPHNRPVVRVETGPAVTPGRFLEAFREVVTRPGPRRKRWPPRALEFEPEPAIRTAASTNSCHGTSSRLQAESGVLRPYRLRSIHQSRRKLSSYLL